MVYADDSFYIVSDKDQDRLTNKLSDKFSVMAEYLTANRLKVNSDKTHLLVMTTEQKRRHNPTRARIVTEVETIEPTEVERLLGAYIPQDMKWTEYLRNNEHSLLHCLNQRVGALKKVAHAASFHARLKVANGIFMSKLIFMIPLWSGCQEFLTDALQICQNKAARTKLPGWLPGRINPLQFFSFSRNVVGGLSYRRCSITLYFKYTRPWRQVLQFICMRN